MREEVLNQIRRNIQKNWNARLEDPFRTSKKQTINCFMFAVGCNIPTEIYVGEINGVPCTISTIGEQGKTFFGTIGQFSNTKIVTNEDIEKCMIADLAVLGLRCVPCEVMAKVPKRFRKIAFFYNVDDLNRGVKNPQFHFMRYDGQYWYHKQDWSGNFQKLNLKNFSIDKVSIEDGTQFIGTYLISLCR